MITELPIPTRVSADLVAEAKALLARRTVRPAIPLPGSIRRAVGRDGVCVLTFDRPDSSANVFDRAALLELDAHLAFLEGSLEVKGVILTSTKPSIFIAGADLHALGDFPSAPGAAPVGLPELIELGQRVFNRLANLPMPTVAAIHGACVGGGYELALACDYRIASADKATKLGLPETQLGILPAWGGSTRLPRLIGLPRALEIILGSKMLVARAALKRGLVDELVPREQLVGIACDRILSGKARPNRPSHWLVNNPLAAKLIGARAHAELLRRTRGHYPAVFKALDVAARGLGRSSAGSLALEREGVLELAGTEEARNLIRLFFLQERAKKVAVPTGTGPDHVRRLPAVFPVPSRCAVIGAGVMGSGIAQWLTSRGLPVCLTDLNESAVAGGLDRVRRLYEAGSRRHVFAPVEVRQGLDRLSPVVGNFPLQEVDLIIEAAVEKMTLKQDIFRNLASRCGPNTILATNTSALSVTELAAATPGPERVVGLHFFNPVHRMQLVEVVRGEATSSEVLDRIVRFVQRIGKLPVVVRDRPGFVVNRILMPYLLEAGHLFEQGARIQDIDEAMLDFGMPMGPLRLIDEVGVDVAQHVARTLVASFSDRLAMPGLLERMLQAGQLGRKTGRGFYRYQGKQPQPQKELKMFQIGETAAGLAREALREQLMMPLLNEAARCLEENVVATAADVDFAMVMGTGFAPFRGGPLRWVDALGVRSVVATLNRLAAAHGEQFRPCELLQTLADGNLRFHPDTSRSPEHQSGKGAVV